MKVIELRLHNFWAYLGDHVFQVDDRGLVLVMGEMPEDPAANSNGSGKSGLFVALDWCLFGEVPTKDTVDSLIHDDAKECWVEALLRDEDGVEGVIRRGRPASLSFLVDGQAPRSEQDQELDLKETQKAIERWLGLDRDVFHSTVLHAQDGLVRYADRTDAGRMEILTKIIPELSEVDELLAPAKARRDEVKAALERVVTEKTGLEGEIRGLLAVDYSQQAAAWEANRAQQIQEVTGRLTMAEEALRAAQGVAGGLGAARAVLGPLEASPEPQAPPVTSPEIQEAEAELAAVNGQTRQLQAERGTAVQDLGTMRTLGEGTCSQCGQVVTAEHLQAEIVKLSASISEKDDLLAKGRNSVVQWGTELERLRVGLQASNELAYVQARAKVAEIAAARAEVNRCQLAAEDVIRRQAAVVAVQKEVEAVRGWQNPVAEQEKARDQKVVQYRTRLTQLEELDRRGKKAMEIAIFWVNALGHDGMKSYILDSKLTELDESCNYWVRLLTGGTTWVRFASQKEIAKGKRLKNAPSIRIYRWRSDGKIIERNFKSLSFGQKERVGRGVDIGLSQLLARRATKRWDLLVLDEIFNHVDSRGAELVAQMLRELRTEKSSIFVVHHNADFQGQFEDRVVVRMKCGASKIVEGSHGEEKKEKEVEGAERGRGAVVRSPQPSGASSSGGVPRRVPVRRGVARRAQ